ncbi:hypothetical protein [Xanthobacter sediminis]
MSRPPESESPEARAGALGAGHVVRLGGAERDGTYRELPRDVHREIGLYDGRIRFGTVIQERDGSPFEAFDADGEHLGNFAKMREAVRAVPAQRGAS